MIKESFADIDKKRGKIGTNVVRVYLGKEFGEILTVTKIISTGRGGTRIYLNDKTYGKARDYKIIK